MTVYEVSKIGIFIINGKNDNDVTVPMNGCHMDDKKRYTKLMKCTQRSRTCSHIYNELIANTNYSLGIVDRISNFSLAASSSWTNRNFVLYNSL